MADRRTPPDRGGGWAILGIVLLLAVFPLRESADAASIALSALLLVLAASVRAGVRAGWLMVAIGGAALVLLFGRAAWPTAVSFTLTGAVAIHLLPRLAPRAAPREAAATEPEQMKDALIASVSHDLRTPLTTIKALAHDIAIGGDERAVVVEEEADRLEHFVTDLLELSQLRAGAAPLSIEPVAAEDVLGAALQRLAGTRDDPRIRATLDATEPLLVGRFDFAHTLRALVNLIENALKYTPADQPVDVTARREGTWLVFEVADRGPGIPPGEAERIFEPFYRRREPPDRGGTGLGLPIARRSARLQDGSLAYSPRPGGGSVFTLRLPAMSPDEVERMSL
jgi:signal transduction histidine kinase